MFQLVYTSSAACPMPSGRMKGLLDAARVKNDRLGVTGMLLYRDQRFLQAIEGTQQAVRRLYEAIRADERHGAVITLRERLVNAREFPGWTMGFTHLEEADPAALPEGDTPFLSGGFTPDYFRHNTRQTHQTLLQFRDAAR